jgi:hypothetical protein
MKKLLILVFAFSTLFQLQAQIDSTDSTVSVRDKFWGIQTNGLELLYYQEHKLTPSIAIRGEAGFTNAFFSSGGATRENTSDFFTLLNFSAEPKWYYNLKKRSAKGKSTAFNAGNYIGLRTSYSPKWVVLSSMNKNLIDADHTITIVPTFGMRRNLGKLFDFELGLGVGYGFYFDGSENYFDNSLFIIPHLRFGFKK